MSDHTLVSSSLQLFKSDKSSSLILKVLTIVLNIAMHRYFKLIVTAIFLSSINSLSAQDEFTFGACESGQESCQECYLTLVKELFGNDGNVFNLSYVFTSPVRDEPSAVVVITFGSIMTHQMKLIHGFGRKLEPTSFIHCSFFSLSLSSLAIQNPSMSK